MNRLIIQSKIFTLIAVFLMMYVMPVKAQQAMKTLKTSGYAPVNGLQMYYEIHGEGGTPLVLIHGGGSTLETSFGTMIPLFSANGKVIAVDMQAHGRTTDRDAPESFEQDADDVAGLLKYLKVDKANIFGFSNGATTALQIAIRHPEVVNKIIALAGADKRERFFPGFFDGFDGATLDMMPAQLREAFLKVTPDQNRLQNMFEKDVERMKNFPDIPDDAIKSIKSPVLIMTGDQDVISPIETAKMAQLIPGAHLAVLPGPHGACIGSLESSYPYGGKKDSKLPQITAALVEDFLND